MGGGCTGVSLTELWLNVLAKKYKCWGLSSEFVVLDNGTRMHCWTPTPPMAENGVWSVPNPKPPLVLLQGFAPNAMLFWKNQVPKLIRDFNVYVPDLVFLGKSTTTYKERLTESFQAECVVKMLQFLGVQDEVDVVGTGYGGFVAFRMAQMYPKYVNKVVFSNTGICMTPDDDAALLQRHGFEHILQLLIPESVVDFKIAIASAPYWKPWLPKWLYQDMVEALYKDWRDERRHLLDDLILGTAEAPPLPKLTQDKILIIWGERDELFRSELAYKLQRHLGSGRARVVMMKKCSHVPQLEMPVDYNRIVKDFLLDQHIPPPRRGQVKPTTSPLTII